MPLKVSRRDLLVGSLTWATQPLLALSSNWPGFRGPNGAGVAEGLTAPVSWNADAASSPVSGVLWRTPVPGLGHSSPILWGDRLFVASAIAAAGRAPLRLGLYGDSN